MSKSPKILQALPAILLIITTPVQAAFDEPVSYPVSGAPVGMTIGDFDQDGLNDVVGALGGGFLLLLNNGSGLGPEQLIPNGASETRAVEIVDIDADGDNDLVGLVRFGDSLIVVLRNNGDGSFATPELFGVPNLAFTMRITDIDTDGDPDVLAVNGFDQALISVLRNDGNGVFDVIDNYNLAFASFIYVADMDLADFNGDGHPDVVGGVDNSGMTAVLLNDGEGGLLPATPVELGQGFPTAVLATDVNNDGRPDVLIGSSCGAETPGDGTIHVGLNDGAGGFEFAGIVTLIGSCHSITTPTSIVPGFFNEDAVIDLVFASRWTDTVRVLHGVGDGTFEAADVLPTDPDPVVVAVGDVDGDGRDDVVNSNPVTTEPDTIVLTTNSQVADTDSDGVLDNADNCTAVANPAQCDGDDDGYGNACDADFDNSGGIVNFTDLGLFGSFFGTTNANADLDCSGGIVNFADLGLFAARFGLAPGPSGLVP